MFKDDDDYSIENPRLEALDVRSNFKINKITKKGMSGVHKHRGIYFGVVIGFLSIQYNIIIHNKTSKQI